MLLIIKMQLNQKNLNGEHRISVKFEEQMK